eukprot:21169-Amphidinium_carterae.1
MTFKTVREDWEDWSFQFKTFLSGANPDAGIALDTAGLNDQPIMMANLPLIEQKFSFRTYAYNGLEAWRQLALEFKPRTAGRRRPYTS